MTLKKKLFFIIITAGLFLFFSPVFAASTTPENIDLTQQIHFNSLKQISIGQIQEESNSGGCTGAAQISQPYSGEHWIINSGQVVVQDFLTTDFDYITSIDVFTAWRTQKMTGNCILYIYDTLPGGAPDFSNEIAESSLPCDSIYSEYPEFGVQNYVFDSPVAVNKNHLYSFTVQQVPVAEDGGESWLGSAVSNVYQGGDFYFNSVKREFDLTFVIYGCTAPIPPPPPKMVCATSTFAAAYMDLEYITGCTEHFTSSTQPDFVEYTYFHIPYLLFLYIVIIFGLVLTVMTMFFKYYGQYSKKKNRW